ncbi:hypothetical protein GNY06_04025 [Elizabethkingia argentiflava]|uniref:Uncharacterized protein n=1 Tax=Elizabethkingia argenteiflava TaxID=2681556 RepID=A0A845PSE9_9FLAO|nr:hypothetical protein [Elizabethkingia argenteiflava]NAW50585.1 hypothetical protein [Elizabethkingia argenteiflava]
MEKVKSLDWFKEEIAPNLIPYELNYRFYEEGDFGSLNQVIFESSGKGGGIDFWSTGWLGVHLVDYIRGEELLNVLLEPHQEQEKTEIFKRLQELL